MELIDIEQQKPVKDPPEQGGMRPATQLEPENGDRRWVMWPLCSLRPREDNHPT